jgi:hypothetical protein
MAQTLKEYRAEKIKDLAADACEPMNMAVEELIERAFDAAVDFVHCNYLRTLETLLADIKSRSDNDGLDPHTACEEISELIECAPKFSLELRAVEMWTNGWIFDEEIMHSSPNDLREKGWAVAVHNDYKIPDGRCTFWLLTKQIGRHTFALKGEGHTDRIALDLIRDQLAKLEKDATVQGP